MAIPYSLTVTIPDKGKDLEKWTDSDTGLECVAIRHRLGHWCGYVAIGPENPTYGKGYRDFDVEVHGGITYANETLGEGAYKIDNGSWWFGFDCAHAGDLVPGLIGNLAPGDVYRDINYVKDQCRSLASQLKAFSPEQRPNRAICL